MNSWCCPAQVGTADGRVKVFGRDTVECTFKSPCQCATKHLQFLDGKGALLRVTQVHQLQAYQRILMQGDNISGSTSWG